MLRPLWVDCLLTLYPVVLAVTAWIVGSQVVRLPRKCGAILLGVALLIVPLPMLRFIPGWADSVGLLLHRLGGTTRLECGAALFLLGVVWGTPRRSLSSAFLGIVAGLIGLVFFSECAGRLWWRFGDPEMWTNIPVPSGFVQQTSGLTCASASAAMLLSHHGIRASEGELAYLSNTSLLGTTALDMADALHIKLSGTNWRPVVRRADYASFQKMDRPFDAHLDLPGLGGHAVFVRRLFDDSVDLVDPRTGFPEKMPRDEFERIWDGTGLLLEPITSDVDVR